MKYQFIYCKKCEQFYLGWLTNFTDPPTKTCPSYKCLSKNIVEFEADSFQEMAQVERQYKIRKLNDRL